MGAYIVTKLNDDKRGILGTVEDTGAEGPGRFLASLRWHRERTRLSVQLGFDGPEEAERWLQNTYEEWLADRQNGARGAPW